MMMMMIDSGEERPASPLHNCWRLSAPGIEHFFPLVGFSHVFNIVKISIITSTIPIIRKEIIDYNCKRVPSAVLASRGNN